MQLVGIKFNQQSINALGKGIMSSISLKKLMINQSNLSASFLQELIPGFTECQTIEYIDFQCNNLDDSCGMLLSKIISL